MFAAQKHRARGFTLIELMVVVVIAAVVLSFAIPSYLQSVLKSHRIDAKNALLDLAAREERYYSVNNSYTTTATALNYSSTTTFPFTLSTGDYSISATVTASPPGYALTATPVAGSAQAKDTTCYEYTLNNLGTQANLNSGGTSISSTGCW